MTLLGLACCVVGALAQPSQVPSPAPLRTTPVEKLTVNPAQIERQGSVIEMRIYAEDPIRFFPAPGTIEVWDEPTGEGVRVDAGYEAGQQVTPFYDPMIAKIMVHGDTREAAIAKAVATLEELSVEGIVTNRGFLLARDILAPYCK